MSTQHESARKAALVKQINAIPNAYARRVEDRYAVGVLDLIFKFPDLPIFFAEGKFLTHGYKFAPTLRQWVEGKKLLSAGLMPLLIGWKKPKGEVMQMYITHWKQEADIRECFVGPGTDTTSATTLLSYIKINRFIMGINRLTLNDDDSLVEMISRFMAAKELKPEGDFYGQLLSTDVWGPYMGRAEALIEFMKSNKDS